MVDYKQLEPWREKKAVILAVNSSLGIAIAEKLLKLKMFVIGVDNDENHIENLRLHKTFKFMKANLLEEEDTIEVFQIVGINYGGADMLVNIMKVSTSTSILDSDTRKWSQTIHRNTAGYALSIREMLRSLSDRKIELGQIVNVINFSDISISNRSQQRLYQILKRTVSTLTKYFDQEMFWTAEFVRLSTISNVIESVEDERRRSVSPTQYADALEFVISMPLHVQIRNIDLEAF